jgi:alpha-1,2-mannosyltransferase
VPDQFDRAAAMTTSPPVTRTRDLLRPPAASLAAGCVLVGAAVWWWASRLPLGVDSAVYRAGAMAVLRAEPLYQPLREAPPWADLPFTYPPVAAILFVPLAVLPVQLGWAGLSVLSVLALGTVVRTVLCHLRPQWASSGVAVNGLVLLSFGLHPIWSTVGFGQVNLVLMALVVVDTLGLRRSRYGGVLTGVAAAVKLTPLIFVLHLAAVGRRAEAARALGTFALLQAAAGIALPADTVDYWTSAVPTWHRGGSSYASNQSLNGLLQRVTGEAGYALPVSVALAAACLLVALRLARRLHAGGQPLAALLVTALCGLLVSPISWGHHWVWVVPLGLLLLDRAARAGPGALPARLGMVAAVAAFSGAAFLAVPAGGDRELGWGVAETLLGNSYLLGALVVGIATGWTILAGGRARPAPAPGG